MSEKTIAIRIDEEFHKKIKIRLAETGLTLKDYILGLIDKDLATSNPIDWKAVPMNGSINEETVKEAQKVLDFVNDVISGKLEKK